MRSANRGKTEPLRLTKTRRKGRSLLCIPHTSGLRQSTASESGGSSPSLHPGKIRGEPLRFASLPPSLANREILRTSQIAGAFQVRDKRGPCEGQWPPLDLGHIGQSQ